MSTPITLKTPLPPGDLRFESMEYACGLSMLDEVQLHLSSDKPDLRSEALLGQPIEVTIELRDGARRHLCGYVARFGIGHHQGRYFGYQARVVPWLWFLTRRADCRIYQDMSVPDIIREVFKNHAAIAVFEVNLVRSYRKRTYCVQYRETDFNFVARLMEDEGIYWYFTHSAGEHKLMIVDSSSAHLAMAGQARIPYYANAGQVSPEVEFIASWSATREVKPGKTALTSYDFEHPSTALGVEAAQPREHELASGEHFDFQGDYTRKPDGEQLADNRLDELQAHHELLSGHTNSHGMAPGSLFELTQHPREDQNAEYLCEQARISAQVHGHESGNPAGDYRCSFVALPSGQQFRPPRRTPRPFVQGPQTAVVVGPAGEEIHTDKYGRVKVQFHWDRYGQKNERSSCWMRVASVWAGKSFGFIQVPRIGQEVVVDFLEGDPDQPIITGRVYNGEQMPPWELPANATQSGVLSRSSKGGAYGNANALRFEDKKGSEQVWLHAEKNQDIEVENDETHWVGHDRTKTVDHDETITIHHDRTETVDHNESITIGNNRTETVGQNESITIGSNRTESVGANESVSIGRNRTMDVADNEALSVGKNREHTVGKDETISVGQHLKHTIAKNATLEVGDKRETRIGKDDLLQVGKKLYLEAGDEITLKTGSASITLKKDGTIQIKGKDITITGSGKIGIKASGNMVVKGAKIAEN